MLRFGPSGNNARFALLLVTIAGTVLLCAVLKAQEIKDQKFMVKTLSPLSASTNQKGDVFTLEVLEPGEFKGKMIEAEVLKAKASGKVKGKSELSFKFRSLVLPDRQIPIEADLVGVSNSKGVQNVDEEGHVIGKSSKKRDVATTAVATGLGALIGGLAGGGSGAAKGAAIGAAIGLTIAFSTKGEDIEFAPGSVFELRVTSQPEKQETSK
ncbi:MAG: hypothetical protein EHM61_20120 [Acidobacteria bacterium]|nr:MAG: hypothetical protein EHM61_20120 [Acidobacteriota bacterium]